MTLDQAIEILKENYKKAKLLCFVYRPVSWALYRTWEDVDREERKGK